MAFIFIAPILSAPFALMTHRLNVKEMVAKFRAREGTNPDYSWETFIAELQREKDLEMQARQASALERTATAQQSRAAMEFSDKFGKYIPTERISSWFAEEDTEKK